MEWEIPQPLDIRPCQKPSEFKARQLSLFPARLKKLPEWVDNATFEVQKKQNQQPLGLLYQKQCLGESESLISLVGKYKNKDKYNLIYQKGGQKYIFNQNFTYQYIPNDYCQLEEWSQSQNNYRHRISEDKMTNTSRQLIGAKREQIIFQSKFQCGNLSKVYQVFNTEQYHLIMENDTNTLGYNQWYAFSVYNTQTDPKNLELRIVNFAKANSLYKKGMKPWSIAEGSYAWKPIEGRCIYRKTNVKNSEGDSFSQLCFNIQAKPGLTFVSMMPIYSYSRLCSKIEKWKSIKGMRIYHKKAYTLINNIVPILEYFPHLNNQFDDHEEELKWYDTIVVFARTHPGEVWSSFLMEEFIQTTIHYHKSNFVKFRYLILPMINPDGVIYGNFRCDFSGVDMNRVWIDPSKFTQPSIFNIKKILTKQFESKKAKYFIDFHSHSKGLNLFAFTSAQTLLQSRLVSDLIRLSDVNTIFDPIVSSSGLSRQFLIQSQTTFISTKELPYSTKKSTARALMSKLTQRGKSMTVEISFYGYEDKKSKPTEVKIFTVRDFNDFAWSLLKKIHDFLNLKEEVKLAKQMLQGIYNFYDYSNENYGMIQSVPRKQTRNIQQNNCDLSQDSDSQPQRYYTAETKRIIKQKNGQIWDLKTALNPTINKKGYLKQTQAMIKRIEYIKKDKSNSMIGAQNRKSKINQVKTSQNLSLPFKRHQGNKKPSFSDYVNRSHGNLPECSVQRLLQQPHENQIKLQSDCLIGERTNFIRKKLITQSKKKQLKFTKEKKQQISISRHLQLPIASSMSSKIEPVIIQIDESKKYEPTFGKFLTKNKRNASRGYKTLVRQEMSINKNELNRMCTDSVKQIKHERFKVDHQISSFLQDKIYLEQKTQGKYDYCIPQGKQTKNNESLLSQPQNKKSLKKFQQVQRKKSKKGPCLDKIHDYKNKYLIERKKIIEMMKKETRFCNQIQRESISAEQIEEIIQKRRRIKTDHQVSKNYFQDRNIFYDNKMVALKNSQIASKQLNFIKQPRANQQK